MRFPINYVSQPAWNRAEVCRIMSEIITNPHLLCLGVTGVEFTWEDIVNLSRTNKLIQKVYNQRGCVLSVEMFQTLTCIFPDLRVWHFSPKANWENEKEDWAEVLKNARIETGFGPFDAMWQNEA